MRFGLDVLATIGLRAAALALTFAGKGREADRLYALADVIEAGNVSDDQMREVAELLRSREVVDADWDALEARIAESRDRLHG